MDANKNNKKIVVLGLILLIIAGLIVVSLKGFNVSLMFGKHEIVELKVGKQININEIDEICKEIFQNQEYVVKELEVFGDSFQINVKSITDDEKNHLINKINEKYEIQKTVDDLKINSLSNKRIRDVVEPYVAPMIISFVIVFVYMLIRFRKLNSNQNLIFDFIAKLVITELSVLSLIAILRIPVNDIVINLVMVIAIIELIWYMYKSEKLLEDINK